MFATKFEVDKHVENCLKKITNDAERNNRSYAFAKLYYNVGEYESSRRFVASYINAKPKSSEGHHLLGMVLEKLGKKENALEAYRTSLQLDPKQNNLVIKICELLSASDIDVEESGAKYFCEVAQSFDPHSSIVNNLKEKIIMSENNNPDDICKLLLKELENRPTDVSLRVRLLKHLLQNNKINEAYKHASEIEHKNISIFLSSLSWYEVITEVFVRYQREEVYKNLNWEFWFLLVPALEKLAGLSLEENHDNVKDSMEYVNNLFNYDQTLKTALESINDCPDGQLAREFINHYRAQLYFHMATAIFKQAKKDLIKYKDAFLMTLPLLMSAYHIPPTDLQSTWLNHIPENKKVLLRRWHNEAAYRCSQTGHILLATAKDRKSNLLQKAIQYSTGTWREQLFKVMFTLRDQRVKISNSYFVTSPELLEVTIKLPNKLDLLKFDEEAQLLHPDSLHQYIWVSLQNELPEMNYTPFDGLQYSIKNLNNCGAETLNVLDIQAFIYCATLCARAKQDNLKQLFYYNSEKPDILPAGITDQLGSIEQTRFLISAYRMYQNKSSSDIGELRLILIRGIEAIRCVGRHGLDVSLLVMLANLFAERSKSISKQSEMEFNDARAELYWKAVLPLLEKLRSNQSISYNNNRLFEYKSKEMLFSDISAHIDKGRLFIGSLLLKRKEHHKALKIFEELKDPYSSFYQAQIYKEMADNQINLNKENLTSEMRSQNIILLSRARDCLYLTLDRLREPSEDRRHPLNSQLGTEIEKIEKSLSRIDPDCTNRNECDGMSDENVSPSESTEHYANYSRSYVYSQLTPKKNHSSPFRLDVSKREARPSPERLDAQLRQLTASKDTAISHLLEQNKIMLESHHSLVDELRGFKDAVYNLTSSVDDLKTMKSGFHELRELKKSMEELKTSVDELQNFRNVTDLVYEMKKDIADLKKVNSKHNQVNDDLYVLDDDYTSDYNINSNLNFPPNPYPNYAPRIPSAATAAASLYPGLYPALYSPIAPYGYPNLCLPQAGLPPFGSEQQIPPEFRALPGTIPQIQQPLVAHNLSQPIGLPNTSLNALVGQGLSQTGSNQNMFKDPKKTVSSGLPLQNVSVGQGSVASIPPTLVSTNEAPVNVVITNSDPLPPTNAVSVSQPILSVTIPPQHIKGNIHKSQPHNYQIPLPPSSTTTTPSVLSTPAPAICTESILFNVAPPIYSSLSNEKSQSKNVSLGLQIEKSLEQTFSPKLNSSDLNRSNISASSIEDYDPCPDFKPLVPLPDEVLFPTGEENENILFEGHTKLYRFVNETKEWKERGVGVIKILQNSATNKLRILMRRDQIYKVCANHFVTKDMNIGSRNENTYFWAAHDFADEVVTPEKFCVKFKKIEDGKKFYEAFEKAKQIVKVTEDGEVSIIKADQKVECQSSKTSLGGFMFSSTPTFKPKEVDDIVTTIFEKDKVKTSPFASFTFGDPKTKLFGNTQSEVGPTNLNAVNSFSTPKTPNIANVPQASDDNSYSEDFVPTAEFKPVVALPDIVDVKTGEEDAEVLFECRAKLLRFNSETKEWKERGLGNMKILKEDTFRLVMRREQIHKVCCNHQLFKTMIFKYMNNNPKILTWCAQDFSEGELKSETFAIRFKNEDQAANFLSSVRNAQSMMDENNYVIKKNHEKHLKSEHIPKTTGFGDKFKVSKGSWECKNCYIVNGNKTNYCVACETPKVASPKKSDENIASGTQFSFGCSNTSAVKTVDSTTTWGNAFKPKEGSWECKTCYVRNDGDRAFCNSCENPKDDTAPRKETNKGINLETPGLKFTFGIPPKPEEPPVTVSSWGESFKPKEGSWECLSCYTRNNRDAIYCISCKAPKYDFIPKKEGNTPVGEDTSVKCSFETANTPENNVVEAKPTFKFGEVPSATTKFSFGDATPNSAFNFKLAKESNTGFTDSFVFGSPKSHGFDFNARSPRRISTGQGDEESDASYVEEEADNIYFKPVIPLPDKVEVKTGEEQEDVLYCHRAKLFRFNNGEWKERGIGDIKILKNKESGKLRVVMRREQVLKICLNHVLSTKIEYISKDEKTWLFYAADYSEGEISQERFCVRFKNGDVAHNFRKAITDALVKDVKVESTNIESENESDVEFISETIVSADDENEAKKLGLPLKFFAYRRIPFCDCVQCKIDDDYFLGTEFCPDKKTASEAEKNNSTVGRTPNSTTSSIDLRFQSANLGTPISPLVSKSDTSLIEPKSHILKNMLSQPSILADAGNKLNKITVSSNSVASSIGMSFCTPKSSSIMSDNLFGSKVSVTSSSSIFGTPIQSEKESESAFKSFSFSLNNQNSNENPNSSVTPSSTLFSANPVPISTNNIFGNASVPSPIFTGSTANIPDSSANKNIFGASTAVFQTSSPSPMFGGNFSLFGDSAKPKVDFGKVTIFGQSKDNAKVATPIFGNSNTTNLFSNPVPSNQTESDPLKNGDDSIFNCKTNISFSSLAKDSGNVASVFKKPTEQVEGETPFGFLGAGAPVFGKKNEKKIDHETTQSGDEQEEGAEGEDYDPHYEPIIPMPATIDIVTGEEDEHPIFNERAKLYRYDGNTKQWKERGVGQMKILNHPVNGTFRFLLRREQVHKVVLNQLITFDMDLQPMTTSDTAWVWAGYNHTDDGTSLEKLAIKFKSCELAKSFYATVENTITSIKQIQSQKVLPTLLPSYDSENNSTSENVLALEDVSNEYDDDDEDYDEEYEDERSIMFKKQCKLEEQLGNDWTYVDSGEIQICYDPEIYGAKILFTELNGETISTTTIGINTSMTVEGNNCVWKAVEWADAEPHWRTLRVTFETEEEAKHYYCAFIEGQNYAYESDIVDDLPNLHNDENTD